MAPLFLGITLSHTHPEHCSDYTNSFLSGVSWPRESIIERTYIVYILFPGQELLFTKMSHYYSFLQMGMPPPTVTSSFSVKREVIWGKASVCGYQHIGMFCQNIFKLSLPNKILFFFSSFRKFLSNPRTMELCLMERPELCWNFKKCQSHHYLSPLFSVCQCFQLWQTWQWSGLYLQWHSVGRSWRCRVRKIREEKWARSLPAPFLYLPWPPLRQQRLMRSH